MITIKVSTQNLYNRYMDCIKDAAWQDTSMLNNIVDVIKPINDGDMEGIRKLFKQGYTAMLIDMAFVDPWPESERRDEIEIRVYGPENNLLGVIIESEINY